MVEDFRRRFWVSLALTLPVLVLDPMILSASHGLLIRHRSAFERARALDAIVFDKTGTLTEGRFGVTDVVSLGGESAEEVLRLAASLESQSEHSIAEGVVGDARE
jgi:Cu2+-exporting ATPase